MGLLRMVVMMQGMTDNVGKGQVIEGKNPGQQKRKRQFLPYFCVATAKNHSLTSCSETREASYGRMFP